MQRSYEEGPHDGSASLAPDDLDTHQNSKPSASPQALNHKISENPYAQRRDIHLSAADRAVLNTAKQHVHDAINRGQPQEAAKRAMVAASIVENGGAL